MSFLFGAKAPAPAAVPLSPANSGEAEAARQSAERSALAERAAAGRRSTIVAGRQIALDEQMERGLLSQRARASREMMG